MLCLIFTSQSFAEQPIQVFIDGQKINFTFDPIIKNGNTLVEFRSLFEKLGLQVGWDESTKTITGKSNNLNIELYVDSTVVKINKQMKVINTPVKIVNDKTMIPLRLIAEATGKKVVWDGNSRIVNISSNSDSSNDNNQTYVNNNGNLSTGSIKGIITWKYNIGTKPDVGACIYLLNTKLPKNSVICESLFGNFSTSSDYSNMVFQTTVDGYGHYEINDIPTGEYVIAIFSFKTYRNYKLPLESEVYSLFKPYLKNYNEDIETDLKFISHKIDTININSNKTLNYSYDFGYKYL